MRAEWIKLIDVKPIINDEGYATAFEEKYTECWAKKQSVSRSEFYSSSRAGFRIDAVFEVSYLDFDNQTQLEYEDTRYTIIRSYRKERSESVELSCARNI